MNFLKKMAFFVLAIFEEPISAGIISIMVYAVFAAQRGPINGISTSPYFNYLADAFLHGQLSLRLLPPNLHDLDFFDGHYFMYWPPFPAITLMPFVAIFGVKFSDVLFTLFFGGLNVSLVAYTLRLAEKKNILSIDEHTRGLLTIFFAFGTVHLLLSSLGIVWFTSQIIAFFCSILVFLAAIGLNGYPAFLFTGVALACATLSRNQLIFLGIWPAYYLFQSNKSIGIKKLIPYILAGILPIVIGVILNGFYNFLRFGNFLEYGLTYQNFGPQFQADFLKYGHFSIHYLAANFYYNFIYYPFPTSILTLMGGSLFLLSPLFIASFWSFLDKEKRSSVIALWLSIIAITVPLLLNIGTGWKTFGPRYTLDFTPPLLLLTALGLRKWPKWLSLLLILACIAQYVIGTIYYISVT